MCPRSALPWLPGACRMCLVEIEKMLKLQTACTTPVTEGVRSPPSGDRQARVDARAAVGQSSADARYAMRRRVRTSGHDSPTALLAEVHGAEKPSRGAVVAGGLLIARAVFVLSLHSRAARHDGRSSRIADRAPSSLLIKKIIWSAKSAACASTSARSAR